MEGLYTVTSLPESFLKCGICKNILNQPRTLTCLHSFCLDCICDFLKENSVWQAKHLKSKCPQCGMGLNFPDVGIRSSNTDSNDIVKSIPENVFLEKVTKTVISLTSENKNCDICSKIGKGDTKAITWCCDCYDSLCESCTGVHQYTSVTSSHQVCSLQEASQKPLSLLLKRKRDVYCPRHEGEIVKLFCKLCCVTLCAQCVTEEHKYCGQCLTISEAFKLREDELDNFSGKLDNLQRYVTKAKSEISENKEAFKEQVDSIRGEIKSRSLTLRKRIEESEKQLLDELDSCSSQIIPEIESRIKNIQTSEENVQKNNGYINQLLQYGCESEIMTSFGSIRDQTFQAESSIYEDVASQRVHTDLIFTPASICEKFNAAFETLGDIQVNSGQPGQGHISVGNWAIACVSRDEIVVIDGANKIIHKYRRGGNLVDQIAVSDEPYGVTSIGVGDIAVTMDRKQIVFLSTISKIRHKHTIKTMKNYHGISVYGPERLAVSSLGRQKCVDIITMEGVIEKTIDESCMGGSTFFEPRYIVSSKGNNQMLLVSDFRQGTILGLSPDGAVKFSYKSTNGHRRIKPLGICIDKIGNTFVADFAKNEIILLTGEGQFQRTVVTGDNEVEQPVAIDISRDGRLMVLQNDGMVKVFSY